MRLTSSLPSFSSFIISIALFSSFCSSASALRILVTPTTTTNAPTTVYWIREASDPQPLFDLRFVVQQDGVDVDDVGLAAANIEINVGGGVGETRMGKEEVRFPKSGQYVLKAVAGPTFQVIGTSNEVVVSPPGTMTLSTSPTATSTSSKPNGTNETGANGIQKLP
ncbi:hypothetical protein NMY22_g11985 [Coprinellus aureogranulatus]|nr:hypothetical protein NMY22_g11985 [Coprinellus aureogranulatus]